MNNMSISSSEENSVTKCDKRKSRRRSSILVKKFSCAEEDAMNKNEEEQGTKSGDEISFEEYYERLVKEKEAWNNERSHRRQRKRKVFQESSKLTQVDWESIQEHLTEEEKQFQAARPDYNKIIETFEKLKKKIEIHNNIKKKAHHSVVKLIERCNEEINAIQDDICEFSRCSV